MTPVIRISDATFARLQRLAAPLVDTPNSVIDRLIAAHTKVELGAPVDTPTTRPNIINEDSPKFDWDLFLAPASFANMEATLVRSVALEDALRQMDAESGVTLRKILGPREHFHCWAMTETKRDVFERMKHGDTVLFSLNNTGLFSYRATILGRFESILLSRTLWPVVNGLPWSLIYVLDNIQRITVSKPALNSELGYNRFYRVPGVIRVNSAALRRAVSHHGSFDELMRSTSE